MPAKHHNVTMISDEEMASLFKKKPVPTNSSRTIMVSEETHDRLLQRFSSHTDTMDKIIAGLLARTETQAESGGTAQEAIPGGQDNGVIVLRDPRKTDVIFSSISNLRFYSHKEHVASAESITWNGAVAKVLDILASGHDGISVAKQPVDQLLPFVKAVAPSLNVKTYKGACPKGWYPLSADVDKASRIVCFQGVSAFQAFRAIKEIVENSDESNELLINLTWGDNQRAAHPSRKGVTVIVGEGQWKEDSLTFRHTL